LDTFEISEIFFSDTNAGDYAVFTSNSDGTVVVGFSYNTYYDEDYELYFFCDYRLLTKIRGRSSFSATILPTLLPRLLDP